MDAKFGNFLSTYFGASYDQKLSKKWKAFNDEMRMHFDDVDVGGWSSYYCKLTWNDETLENEADLEIFDLLLKIDMKNGADTSKIVNWLCTYGAFEAVKVRTIKLSFRLILFFYYQYDSIFKY